MGLSRTEEIVESILNGTSYNDSVPMSRLEELFIELKQAIEAGGGGSGSGMTPAQIEALKAQIITEVNESIPDENAKILASITTDGVKTWQAILKDLYDACITNGGFSINKKYELQAIIKNVLEGGYVITGRADFHQVNIIHGVCVDFSNRLSPIDFPDHIETNLVRMAASSPLCVYKMFRTSADGVVLTDNTLSLAPSGTVINVIETNTWDAT